ncbi:MAG: BON domain-containing protein [Deltaproteobacteria bacterium]|nr:BON domain-containing protein [Deltaproteobacteria bacterium]
MHKLKMITVLIVCACILCAIYSCATPAGRTPGQVVDDGTITTKVKAKLLNDAILSGFAISVKTFKGEVTLTGSVDSKYTRDKATFLARNTLGVIKVKNLIKMK